jgi:SAM-dependent methyltransferase
MRKINNAYERTRQKKIARIVNSGSVLDIGYAQLPNRYYSGIEAVGLDLEMPSEPSGYAEEIQGNALDLSRALGNRRFDWIVAGEFIEHVRNPYDFLDSLHPFLKDNGRIVLSTPNPVGWPTLLFEWLQSKTRFYTEEHLYYFAPRWVHRMLDFTGFQPIDTLAVGLWAPGIILPCPVALSYQVIYVAKPK